MSPCAGAACSCVQNPLRHRSSWAVSARPVVRSSTSMLSAAVYDLRVTRRWPLDRHKHGEDAVQTALAIAARVIDGTPVAISSTSPPVDLNLRLDLDRDIEGQGGHADGGAGVLADLASPELEDQIGKSVDDSGSVVEAGRDVHHSKHA